MNPGWWPVMSTSHFAPTANDDGQPLPLPRGQHPYTLGKPNNRISRIAQRHGLVESRMRGDAHVRFGGRAEET
jgi:hypothetical protein